MFFTDSVESLLETLGYGNNLTIDLGLDNLNKVFDICDLYPKADQQIILVSGTNGKGSTVKLIESFLLLAGHSVGVFSSPHLSKYTERYRIQGIDCSEDIVLSSVRNLDTLLKQHQLQVTPFELSFLIALFIFRSYQLDFFIFEVGMGGRLDAVNTLSPTLSVITSVGLDHMNYLGPNYYSIAYEKMGIARPGIPLVADSKGFERVIDVLAFQRNIPLFILGKDFHYQKNSTELMINTSRYQLLLSIEQIPFWYSNIAIACQVMDILGIDTFSEISQNLGDISLAGRFESLLSKYILDVAHNSHAVLVFRNRLLTCYEKGTHLVAIVAFKQQKDVANMIDLLLEVFCIEWYFLIDNSHSEMLTVDAFNEVLATRESSCFASESPVELLDRVKDQKNDVIVFGSFFVVKHIRELLVA